VYNYDNQLKAGKKYQFAISTKELLCTAKNYCKWMTLYGLL